MAAASGLAPPCPGQEQLTPDEANRLMPRFEIFERDGQRLKQFYNDDGSPMGEPLPLEGRATRVVGAGHPVLQRKTADGRMQKFSLDRPPYIPFLAFKESEYQWLRGALPLRRDLNLPNRHPMAGPFASEDVRPWDLDLKNGQPPLEAELRRRGQTFDNYLATAITTAGPLREPSNQQAGEHAVRYALFADYYRQFQRDPQQRDDYARKAILILLRIAEVYAKWPTLGGNPQPVDNGAPGVPQPPARCAFGPWIDRPNQFKKDLWAPAVYAEAYDRLYNSPVWQTVSRAKGFDVRCKVEEDLLHYILWSYARFTGFWGNNRDRNATAPLLEWAVRLDDPLLYHYAVQELVEFADEAYFADGTYWEVAAGYTQFVTVPKLGEVKSVPPYAPPPGWQDFYGRQPIGPERLAAAYRRYLRSSEALRRIRMPDGRFYSINESGWFKGAWAEWGQYAGAAFQQADAAPDASKAELRTWDGQAVLGRGRGRGQVQAHLNFKNHPSPHVHDDSFSLHYFAKGQELIADNSYVTGDGWCRGYSRSAEDHPRVVVYPTEAVGKASAAGAGSAAQYVGGKARPVMPITQTVWSPDPPVQATEVFQGATRRTIVLVPTVGDNTYLVDVYRVAEAGRQEWSIYGPSQHDVRIVPGLALGPEDPATRASGPTDDRFVHVRSAATDETFTFDIVTPELGLFATSADEVKEGNPPGNRIRRGCLRTTLVGSPGTVVRLGLTPNARQYEQQGPQPRAARKDQIRVCRTGPGTVFIAVHEPYEFGVDQPRIESVRLLSGGRTPQDTIVLEILVAGRTDIVMLGLDRDAHYAGSGIEARGRLAFAALRNGRPEILHLVDGDLLRAGEQAVRANRAYAGEVVGILRRDAGDAVNAFVVDQPLPSDLQLPGRWLTIELGDGVLHRFPISEVRRDAGRTWLVVGDEEPGLALETGAGKAPQDRVRYTHYLWRPHACVLGPLRFRVTDQATYQR